MFLIVSVSNQVYVFFSCILGGLAIGLLFDIFRLSRKFIETGDVITYIEDIMFWFLVGVIVLMTVYLSNNGQIRGYVFLGILLGVIFYFLAFSTIVMKVLSGIVKTIVNIIGIMIKVTVGPLKMIMQVSYRPIKYLYNKIVGLKNISIKLVRLFNSWILQFRKTKKTIKEKLQN